jgi:alpha-1,2-mannosyltransferase
VLIGLMCLVKPHYGLFVLWAMLRREWRFTVACAATVLVGLITSIAVFGWVDNVDYLRVFWFLSQHGEAYYPNQSFSGLLNRLMSLVDPELYNSVEFDDHRFPPFVWWIYAGTLLTSFAIIWAALFRRRTDGDPDRAFDFCTMALSITIASPIAWEHHYGILLPVFALLLTGSLGRWPRLVLIAASYVVISNFYSVANMLAWTYLNFVQSYVFFAALVVLMLLHTARPGWQLGGFRFARLRSPALALKPR